MHGDQVDNDPLWPTGQTNARQDFRCAGHDSIVPSVFSILSNWPLESVLRSGCNGSFSMCGLVAGYVLKDEAPKMVVQAIHAVMQGDTWFSKPIVEKLARPAPSEALPAKQPALTEREVEVLRLLARGYSNAHIAQELGISGPTVRFHLRNIYDKTGLQSRTEAVAWAIQQGLVDEG